MNSIQESLASKYARFKEYRQISKNYYAF